MSRQILRVTGLVRTMNQARARLAAGIPKAEQPAFRKWVQSLLSDLEGFSRANHLRLEDMPAPSYRAYRYLKEIDLDHLPLPAAGEKPPPTSVRISNIITISGVIQEELKTLVKQPASSWQKGAADFERHLARVAQEAVDIDGILSKARAAPGALPPRSLRAYQWLTFLSNPENLADHLQALQAVRKIASQAVCRKLLPRPLKGLEIDGTIFHTSALYRSKVASGKLQITFSEGFLYASPELLEDLVCAALIGKSSPHLDRVRRYADSDDYRETLLELDLIGVQESASGQGQVYNLEEIFRQVNREYFGGRMEKPRLTWNRTVTQRKLGHYQPSTDTVMISVTLDQAAVPRFVLEYVLYHELLHKQLGYQVSGSRRFSHGTEFKAAERQFQKLAEAQEFLKNGFRV